jgi:mono/diheme cytochrome c family protein
VKLDHLLPLAKPTLILLLLQAAPWMAVAQSPTESLDFDYYRTHVELLFLKKRPGHARCVVCHAGSTNALHLQPLTAGSTAWTEEQSRRNFKIVSLLVTPGDPNSSHLLLHPLSPDAGGDAFHSGGRQFASREDPDWRVLADWVRNAKPASAAPAGTAR